MFSLCKFFLKRVLFKVKYNKVKFKKRANAGKNSSFEGWNVIGENSWFYGDLGLCTYIGKNCTIIGKVGKFCSIGHNVVTLVGKHPLYPFVSTSPVFYSIGKQTGVTFVSKNKFSENTSNLNQNNVSTVIGNDVWIGFGVVILPGIKIGDGAIIGAGAIVTKDVEPFSIVAGNPAKVIRKRFNDDLIISILEKPWWENDLEWIKRHAKEFENIKFVYKDK